MWHKLTHSSVLRSRTKDRCIRTRVWYCSGSSRLNFWASSWSLSCKTSGGGGILAIIIWDPLRVRQGMTWTKTSVVYISSGFKTVINREETITVAESRVPAKTSPPSDEIRNNKRKTLYGGCNQISAQNVKLLIQLQGGTPALPSHWSIEQWCSLIGRQSIPPIVCAQKVCCKNSK